MNNKCYEIKLYKEPRYPYYPSFTITLTWYSLGKCGKIFDTAYKLLIADLFQFIIRPYTSVQTTRDYTLRTIPRYYFEQDNSFKERELINFLCDGYYSWNSITNNPKRIIRIITSLPCIIHKAFGGEKCPYNFTSYYKNVVVPIKKITLS